MGLFTFICLISAIYRAVINFMWPYPYSTLSSAAVTRCSIFVSDVLPLCLTKSMDSLELGTNLQTYSEDNDREATELRQQFGDIHRDSPAPADVICHKSACKGIIGSFKDSLSAFWKHQISATAPHTACRDHLGMCEFPKHSRNVGPLRLNLWGTEEDF